MNIVASMMHFFDALPAWLTAITSVIAAASAVTALTPTPKDDQLVARVMRIVELLALNVGHAKRK